MHVATRLFDSLCDRQASLLNQLGYEYLHRQRQLVRLAALLHDVGHAPFSHAAEELLPKDAKTGKHFTHEQYSAAIVQHAMKDVIEGHPFNRQNFSFSTNDLSAFFREEPSKEALVLRDLVSGQMDADRMDYMLRDSLHCGVTYGRYDLNRLAATIKFIKKPESDSEYSIGVDGDGIHAAEGLIIARYMMFTQIYFHKTRVIYDFHLAEAIKEILADHGGVFPMPTSPEEVEKYLQWDDWRILGALSGLDTAHGTALKNRMHYRLAYQTKEVADTDDIARVDDALETLRAKGIDAVRRDSSKSWYKFDNPASEILVSFDYGQAEDTVSPMSDCSPAVRGLPPVRQSRIYVPMERRGDARQVIQKMNA
jgi:hypothetical protein